MTENQKNLGIAFYKQTYGDFKGFSEQEVWSGARIYKENNLKENKPFEAELEYAGFTRGRSALNIRWVNRINKVVYYSAMSLLDRALMDGNINLGKLRSEFVFKKQGTSILLEFA